MTTTAADPAHARWDIILAGFFPGQTKQGGSRDLQIHVRFDDGRWSRSLATAPTWNGAQHGVTAQQATLIDEHLTARCTVLLHADAWLPKDGQPIPIEVAVDATVSDGQVSGTWRSTWDDEPISGTIGGQLTGARGAYDHHDRVRLTVQPVPEGPPVDGPHFELITHVHGGTPVAAWIGPTYKGPAAKLYPLDDLSGSWTRGRCDLSGTVPAGAVDRDPSRPGTVTITLTAVRVAQAVVGELQIEGFAKAAMVHGTANIDDPKLHLPGSTFRHQLDDRPWFAPVDGFSEPVADEHPRLLFRRADIPALRAKAATATGQGILVRLRHVLGDSEAMPTVFNDHPVVGQNAKGDSLPVGAFTCWHGAGFGLLHVLTGEQRYADLALTCADKVIEGHPDRDERYCWRDAGGLRIGAVIEGVVLAYDCCHDAWSPPDRARIRDAILGYDDSKPDGSGKARTLLGLMTANGYPPGSNHYGAYIGGQGLAALCFKHDSDVDHQHIDQLLAAAHQGIVANLTFGFGDYGAFAEGHHPARLSANSAFLPLIQAMRIAHGHDYLATRPEAAGITLRWIHELTCTPSGGVGFQHRGVYGDDEFDSGGISHAGEFAHGFGVIPSAQIPALLWTWQQVVDPHERPKGGDERWRSPATDSSWNAWAYPHRAFYAFVNWPLDVEAANPAASLPRCAIDHVHGYLMCRERWQDADDLLVSLALSTGPRGYYRFAQGTDPLRIWGRGLQAAFPLTVESAAITHFLAGADGSALISWTDSDEELHLAIDLSGASGFPAVILLAGGQNRSDPVDTEPVLAGGHHAFMHRNKVGTTTVTTLTVAPMGVDHEPAFTNTMVELGKQSWTLTPSGWEPASFTPA